jgi:RNA polymerase sigma-70 factor (ECF subfamily)
VIATIPESGVAGVDPALTELRVTFSKPMQDWSWSWTQWGEDNFPEMTGQPRFDADERTCVLPVKLQPGKVYATWINSDRHKNFIDTEGRPAVPYLLIFETRESGQLKSKTVAESTKPKEKEN